MGLCHNTTPYAGNGKTDPAALLARPDIDAVVISTPHYCHLEEALLAAEHNKHALVEKPLTTSLADCDRLIESFEAGQLTLAVGYHQRFRESNRVVGELVQSGAIGTVRAIQMSALFDIEALRQDEGFGGGWEWWKDPRSVDGSQQEMCRQILEYDWLASVRVKWQILIVVEKNVFQYADTSIH